MKEEKEVSELTVRWLASGNQVTRAELLWSGRVPVVGELFEIEMEIGGELVAVSGRVADVVWRVTNSGIKSIIILRQPKESFNE
jgi:hypothetical protein